MTIFTAHLNYMKFTAKTFYGLEGVLAAELKELGAFDVTEANRAVMFSGNRELLYRVNYCSRTALSVLVHLNGFRIRSVEDLYRRVKEIDWDSIMDQRATISVVPVVHSDLFNHSKYPALVVKDAIADYFRDKTGIRPSVNVSDPDMVINVHISNDRADISLDSSVIPLYKRGYRIEQGQAPLNEVLAAGMLKLSGWDEMTPLHDPMCGSGTLLVEAAMLAAKIPPGKMRKFFGFTRWKDFDNKLFEKVKREADDAALKEPPGRISGSDISEETVKQAKINISNAGLADYIELNTCDFKDSEIKQEKGFLIFNPPYGQRIRPDEIEALYSSIGSTLKHLFSGFQAWIITSDKKYLNNIGLKTSKKFTLFNGSLECVFAGYELYKGSKKGGE
jgi:putative N6-adenine-specific DNA methylase